jgi:hypothetical protein
MLILELQGNKNIGDVINPSTLLQIADLGLGLGLEVFPATFA